MGTVQEGWRGGCWAEGVITSLWPGIQWPARDALPTSAHLTRLSVLSPALHGNLAHDTVTLAKATMKGPTELGQKGEPWTIPTPWTLRFNRWL